MGKLVRDDNAMQMVKTAIRSLPMDVQAILENITELVMAVLLADAPNTWNDPRQIQFEIERILAKKEAVMDSYFSREITKEDMQAMNRKYDAKLEELHRQKREILFQRQQRRDSENLRIQIQTEIADILNGNIESDVFYKNLLDCLTVFQDRHMELRLKYLPHIFRFSG